MHSSGKTIVLIAGDYRAQIVSVGAGIAELTHRGRHLTVPHLPEEMPPAHLGKVLLPWPNRIVNGNYRYQDVRYALPLNDRDGNSAIHGLLAWREWQIGAQSATSVTLSAFLPPSYGYPFMLASEVTYRLDPAAGLHVEIASRNIGNGPAPYGVGAHPYITCDLAPVDECRLTLPAAQIYCPAAARLSAVDTEALDFLTPRQIGDTRIDHTFKAPASAWQVTLAGKTLTTFLRSDQPWLQVYTGEKLQRAGLAVEPMSCPPDAFNSGVDLLSLPPRASHHLFFAIGCEQAHQPQQINNNKINGLPH